ncbi:MAG: 3-hydroxyacyl-CoA dehydrogenase NAD-binding domain-containing protein [Candidatus Thorarchaeota archaeon]
MKKFKFDSKLKGGITVKSLLNQLVKKDDLRKAVKNADFVIEAVSEVMEIKKEVYERLGECTD